MRNLRSTNRRHVLIGAIAAPAVIAASRLGLAAPAQVLKISHQFPGGTIDEGDFRDRLCLKFAAELEKRTNGALGGQVYPNSSLMKTIPQFSSLRRGALDLSLYPISYAGGEVPETNIGLMPGLVSSYKQGAAWKTAAVGKKFDEFLRSKNVIIVSWVWQAGGVVSRGNPIVQPSDAKGLKIRGGSREMDMMLQAAGAATLTAFTAAAIARIVPLLPKPPKSWIVVGGGARHLTMLKMLRERLKPAIVEPADVLGWATDAIEAQAFGFLAARGLKGLPLSYPATTGVPIPMTGGIMARP